MYLPVDYQNNDDVRAVIDLYLLTTTYIIQKIFRLPLVFIH